MILGAAEALCIYRQGDNQWQWRLHFTGLDGPPWARWHGSQSQTLLYRDSRDRDGRTCRASRALDLSRFLKGNPSTAWTIALYKYANRDASTLARMSS